MRFIYMPTLCHASTFAVASSVWTASYLHVKKATRKKQSNNTFSPLRQATCDEAKNRVHSLTSSNKLQKEIIRYIESIGVLVEDWFEIHEHQFRKEFQEDWIDHIRWSWKGTIDKRKTAESLVMECATLSPEAKYKLACAYCLEDYIKHNVKPYTEKSTFCKIIRFWAAEWECLTPNIHLKEVNIGVGRSFPDTHRMWLHAALCGNEIAVDYFLNAVRTDPVYEPMFNKLVEQRMEWIRDMVSRFKQDSLVINIVGHLFNNMEESWQMKLFQSFPYVLRTFGAWPWNNFLFEVFDYIPGVRVETKIRNMRRMNLVVESRLYKHSTSETYASTNCYCDTFMTLMNKRATLYSAEGDCREMLRLFWKNWDDVGKMFWFNFRFKANFCDILRSNHVIDIKLILSDAIFRKEKFTQIECTKVVLKTLIKNGKWGLLLDFITDSKCSQEDITDINFLFQQSCLISGQEEAPVIMVYTRDNSKSDGKPHDNSKGDGEPRDSSKGDGEPRDNNSKGDGEPRDSSKGDGERRDSSTSDATVGSRITFAPESEKKKLEAVFRNEISFPFSYSKYWMGDGGQFSVDKRIYPPGSTDLLSHDTMNRIKLFIVDQKRGDFRDILLR